MPDRGQEALIPQNGGQSVVELPDSPQSLSHVLRIAGLQLLVGNIVGVGELREVAPHLGMCDFQRGRVRL